MSQYEIAAIMGISQQSICKIEKKAMLKVVAALIKLGYKKEDFL